MLTDGEHADGRRHIRTACWSAAAMLGACSLGFLIWGLFGYETSVKEASIWIVATTIAAVPVLVVLAELERQEPKDQGLILATVLVGTLFAGIVELVIVGSLKWLVGGG